MTIARMSQRSAAETRVVLRLEAGEASIDFVTERRIGPGRVVLLAPGELLSNTVVRRKATRDDAVDLIENVFRWVAE